MINACSFVCWSLLYSTILHSLHLHVTTWVNHFFKLCILISTKVVHLQRWHGWCHRKLLPSQHVLCTPYNHAPWHFIQSHIRKVHVCLAVTCHLHFWQNDQDLLRATVVTWGWNRCRNKSHHRKLTTENKILPPLLQGLEPTTFNHESGALTTEPSLFPENHEQMLQLESVPLLDQNLRNATATLCEQPTTLYLGVEKEPWRKQTLISHRDKKVGVRLQYCAVFKLMHSHSRQLVLGSLNR